MPLDNARKIAHIQALVAKSWVGRNRVVTFVYQASGGGSYTYTATLVIFRPIDVVDPQIPTVSGGVPSKPADLICIAPLATPTTGLVFVADTVTATSGGVAAAILKYQPIEITPTGIVPGGTHLQILLRRFR